ncbi:phytanoyl-CoA dioxygenase family protein [Paenibacillus oceani]|uniref:Phytanoyl-CoA dioxygenase family protein n=1 Tax=Paenibacillus oceani TaxID=2772510 RepID=A0A927C7Y1_9BACL|nr:phytanoyl-CoA dioxygenase family protein [Paenibacillus oceani]MBD2863054.1 phytanoyl-CoA dioxygenase family protein [Paenibacillus oceani]
MAANEKSPEEIARLLYQYDNMAIRLDSPAAIGPDEIKLYHEQGYLAVTRVLSGDDTNRSIQALMSILFQDANGAKIQFTKPENEIITAEERELSVRKIYEFVHGNRTLYEIAHHPELLACVEKLLGEEAVLIQDMALLKPPHGGGEKPWHQDMAYGPLAYDKAVVGVWIALDEAALDNGCMHLIPRSHMDGGTPHYAKRDWQVCDDNVQVERDVAVPLPPGGVLFFHGLLIHGTPPNFSIKRRRALQFHYAAASSVKMSPKEYKRMFTNELTGATC